MNIRRKLNIIKRHVNELDAELKRLHGREAYIYFEAEGGIYAMANREGESGNLLDRQKPTVEYVLGARFDCGAW